MEMGEVELELELELEVAADDVAGFLKVEVETGIFMLMSVVINLSCWSCHVLSSC